ncbi:MAG TPA: tetratricopeptide repeat protein [Candidatus Polarisedimenticolaceae bacterium]|nr:tetratricopeptide repeat protein [Candidatus Polarisedimenticolaceae bacterium]
MRRGPGREALLLAFLVLASIATFWPTLHAGFITDDFPIVQMNPVVHRGEIREIFGTGWWEAVGGVGASLYRPVTVASWLPERGPDGRVRPERAHLDNLLLHALTGYALAFLLRRWGIGFAAASGAALLFVLHPGHVSAVGGLVGRAEILSTLFSLLALVLMADTGPWPGQGVPSARRARLASWGAAACVFLALGSKEGAAALPGLLVLQEVLFRRDHLRPLVPRLAALAPSVLAVVCYAVLRLSALADAPGGPPAPLSDNPIAGLSGQARVATALSLVPRYTQLLLWPRDLSVDQSGHVIATEPSLASALPLLGAAVLGALCLVIGAALLGRAGPAAGMAAALTLLSYLVVGNLLRLVGVAYAERLFYLPSAGALALLAVGAHAFLERRPRARPALALSTGALVLLALFAGRSAAAHWRSHEAVFEQAVRATPDSPRAQFTLAMIRLEQGRLDEALSGFDRTIALWPTFASAWYGRGVVHARRGAFAEAAAAFAEAARLAPGDPAAAADLGVALHRAGRTEEAERQLRRTLRRFGPSANVAGELGILLAAEGRLEEARGLLAQAVAQGRRDLAPALQAAGGPPP